MGGLTKTPRTVFRSDDYEIDYLKNILKQFIKY